MKTFPELILFFCLLTVTTKLITGQTKVIRREEVHSDTTLICNGPTGRIRWGFKKIESLPSLSITAANGSHYEISEVIVALKIVDCREEDEGIYIAQGDGGIECHFMLYIYGLFSFNSGAKNSISGNYEETVEAIDGYGLTVSCSYDITEVSDPEDTFVDVEGIISQVSISDCTLDEYPFCEGCEACYPRLNNNFRQNIVYPAIAPGSASLKCRVNLGINYNGKTVEKIVTISRKAVQKETYVVPYKSDYKLCSNTLNIQSGVLVSTQLTGDVPNSPALYSLQLLPTINLMSEINISCQNVDTRGLPLVAESYQYSIQLSAIPMLSNTQEEEEHFNLSYCDSGSSEVVRTFNCSYQLVGASEGQTHNKNEVTWRLDAAPCSAVCQELGEYKEENLVDIKRLGNNRTSEHTLSCNVSVNGVSVDKEWKITLSFEECTTTVTTTIIMQTPTPTPTPAPTTATMSIVTTTRGLEPTPSTVSVTTEVQETPNINEFTETTTFPTVQTGENAAAPSTGILIAIIIPSIIFAGVVISLATIAVIILVIFLWTKEKKGHYSQVKSSKQNGVEVEESNSVTV